MLWHVLLQQPMALVFREVRVRAKLDQLVALSVLLVDAPPPQLICPQVLADELDVGVDQEADVGVDVVGRAEELEGWYFSVELLQGLSSTLVVARGDLGRGGEGGREGEGGR